MVRGRCRRQRLGHQGIPAWPRAQVTYDAFLANGTSYFEKLPPGWRCRVVTLQQDLIETPRGGVATIMSDEFFNVYDKAGPDR